MKDYLMEWDKESSSKSANNKQFIFDFINFIESKDKDHFEFIGENNYCGYTAIVYEDNPNYCMGRTLSFEFAYDTDFVKVFTANHGGFWVPEYIDLRNDDAQPILKILHKKFIQWGGFKSHL